MYYVRHSRFVDNVSLFSVDRSASGAMLLCGVLHAALSVSIGAIVQILIFLLQNSNILRVQASLPPGAEDEIILIEHLPGRRVHLQDFFWSDAKDAPPWIDPNQGLTLYETRTVHHTVTLYSPVDEEKNDIPTFPLDVDSNEPKCVTCIEPTPRLDNDEEQNIGVLIGEDPGPRYWLLTVLRAGEAVPPKIELKLARLYRTAFSRQQQRHLGLLQTEKRLKRVRREHGLVERKAEIVVQEQIFENSTILSAKLGVETHSELEESTISNPVRMVEVSKFQNSPLPMSNVNDIENRNEQMQMEVFQIKQSDFGNESVVFGSSMPTTTAAVDFNESTTDYTDPLYLQTNESSNLSSSVHYLQNVPKNSPVSKKQVSNNIDRDSTNKRSELRSLDPVRGETVQVRMQNTSVTEGGATKLIYSVHLGGKPVPAETAAKDMALLSPQEVALELGAPVLIQSEPYLKETRPLALSRKRDAWLLIGAASAGFVLLALVVAGLIFVAKKKRAHSAVAAPPSHNILKKKRDYVQTSDDHDNVFSTSLVEVKTDGTSQRPTVRSSSRTPVFFETAGSLEDDIHEVSSDDEEQRKAQDLSLRENLVKKPRLPHTRIPPTNIIDTPRTSDSTDVIVDHLETLDSLENNYTRQEDATASPHSYLSMPSCKHFPSMKSVEPLSRVLEPVTIKHLDIDSPELVRRDNNHYTDMYSNREINQNLFARTSSAFNDPGVVGPIVWDLRRQNLSEGNGTSETDIDPIYAIPSVPVGRARRRLHELLEDSFSLFGSRDPKSEMQSCTPRPTSAAHIPDVLTIFSETAGKPINASPVLSQPAEMITRPRTSLVGKPVEGYVAKNGQSAACQSQRNWGSRPLSAGPFHRPNLPDIDTRRILTDCQLPPEDSAVPLIASIKKELEKFSPQ